MLKFVFFRGLSVLLFSILLPEPLSHMFCNPDCFCISDPDFMLLASLYKFWVNLMFDCCSTAFKAASLPFFFCLSWVCQLFNCFWHFCVKAEGIKVRGVSPAALNSNQRGALWIRFCRRRNCSTEQVLFPSYRLPSLFTQRVCSGLAWARFSMSNSHSTHFAAPLRRHFFSERFLTLGEKGNA